MKRETIEKIKAWFYDFRRKNDSEEYVYTDGDMVDKAEELFKQILEEEDPRLRNKTIQECLDYLLEDDETETGGISYVGYTLRDFLLEENGGTLDDIIMDADVSSLDVALKMAGIKPIK